MLPIVEIFIVNSKVIILLAIGGLLLAIPTLILLILNGMSFGIIVATIFTNASPGVVLLAIGTHGLFELPAIWLAGGIGLSISNEFLRFCLGWSDRPYDIKQIRSWAIILLGALGLTAIGAGIEATVTPFLVDNIGQ